MLFVDSHFHLTEEFSASLEMFKDFAGVINVSTYNEMKKAEEIKKSFPLNRIAIAFGAFSFFDYADDAETLLRLGKNDLASMEALLQKDSSSLDAIGEAVLDAFSSRRQTVKEQLEIFRQEMVLAKKYKKPLVIHCVRCMPLIFEFSSLLKELPALIFHGWSGSADEAQSLLNRGLNCFFSIGPSLVNGKKSAAASAVALPLERLLLETDYPHCKIKGVKLSQLESIQNVYSSAAEKRGISIENLSDKVYYNFSRTLFNSTMNSL